MYYIETKNNICTGNYSKDIFQDSFEEYVEVEDLEYESIQGYKIVDGKVVPGEIDVVAICSEITELEDYLNSTDWYITRKFEIGKDVPIEILSKRIFARDRISELREKIY